MYWCRKHVLICTASHCMQKGANNVAGRLRLELKRRGLDEGLMVNTCDSIELCDIGPNIVVYPEGVIYSGVQVSDLNDIIDHLTGGPPVERLVLSPDTPTEQEREHFYREIVNISEEYGVPADEFAARAVARGYDEGWINEQARRGFIARKEREGNPVIVVTSKALARYRIATPDVARS